MPRSRSRRCSASPSSARCSSSSCTSLIDVDADRLRPGDRRHQRVQPRARRDPRARPARHRLRRDPLGQDPHARRGARRGAAPAAGERRVPRPRRAGPRRGEVGYSSQITRRPLIKYTLGGALGLFAVPLVLQVAGSLGPMPQKSLSLTFWNGGPSGPGEEPEFTPLRLMRDPENTPIKAEDVTVGSVFHVLPEGLLRPRAEGGTAVLEEKAKAAVLAPPPRRGRSIESREAARLGLPGHRRLLQDLHPRRLPGRPVRAADAPPAVPVPPVDLRRDPGLQGHLRTGEAAAAPAEDHRR